jgi:CheY-like chemotaxis protein
MPIVLAIEPDLRQAAIIKRIVRDKIHADVVVVDSRDAALDAIRTSVPDVLLLSALLSPRDEDELIAHLRLLDGAEHLQTHTIPQLAGSSEDRETGRSRGLLGMFSRKKDPEPVVSGCDPDLFAEEIRTYLQHAHEKKEQRRLLAEQGIEIETPGSIAQAAAAAPAEDETTAEPQHTSSWSDPFAWRPSSKSSSKTAKSAPAVNEEPAGQDQEPVFAPPESVVASSEVPIATHESVILDPEPVVADEPILQSAEPAVEHYESVLRDPEPVVASQPLVQSTEPAVEYYESVLRNPEPVVASQPLVQSTEPAIEYYESVLRPEPIVAPDPESTRPPRLINPEPVVAAPAAADPWAVDYYRRDPVAEGAPSMVGYTAPFASRPAEPLSLVDSATPSFEPTVDNSVEVVEEREVVELEDPEEVEVLGAVEALEEVEEPALVELAEEPEAVAAVEERHLVEVIEEPEAVEVEEPAVVEVAAGKEIDIEIAGIEGHEETEAIEVFAEPEIEERPVVVAPMRSRSRRAAQSSLLRLMPLAMWARAEIEKHPRRGAAVDAIPDRSVNDELRDLMSRLAVPLNVAGVSYARGCKIRRVRVLGGRERRQGETPGPVILSKRALEERRAGR